MQAGSGLNRGLGFDFGTSGARINVVDKDSLAVVHDAAVKYEEQSPEVWVDAMHKLLDGIPKDVKATIGSVAVSGTSASCLLVSKTSGKVTRPPLMYYFAAPEPAVLRAALYAPTGHTVRSGSSTLPKLLYWHASSPLTPDERLAHQADYLASELTGASEFTTDWNNVLKLGYDVKALEYPEWMLKLLEAEAIDPQVLPAVVPPGGFIQTISPEAAQRFSLPTECQVVGGTTDSIAAFIASRANAPGQAVTSLGSTLAIKMISSTQVDDAAYGVYSHRLGDSWLVGGASNVGCAVLRQEKFSNEELAELSAKIDPASDPPPEFKYYPLTKVGERFPINDPKKAPVLEPKAPSREVYLHALLHAIAKVEAEAFQKLEQLGADRVQSIYTAGGGSANLMWSKMRERVIGVEVKAVDHTEASYGVALLALGLAQ